MNWLTAYWNFSARAFIDEIVIPRLVSYLQFYTSVDLHAVHKTIVADLDMQTSIVGVSETSK
jgi:hypothetical protein